MGLPSSFKFVQKLSVKTFLLPSVVLLFIVGGLFHIAFAYDVAIILGLIKVVFEGYEKVREGRFSLDYIAFTAMIVSLVSGHYLAGSIIALMFTGGEALEAYASDRAEASLRILIDKIPKKCLVRMGDTYVETPIHEVVEGSIIVLKQHEIIPLDGTLVSKQGVFNTANLTGEPDPIVLPKDSFIKSGLVNSGETIELTVVGDFSSSTYKHIIDLVEDAHRHPPRIVRLSEKANIPFTLITFAITVGVYLLTGEIGRALAVLVIATPCPLIIAAPVAFIGGMSKAAREGIIIRRPITLEIIKKATTIFFDKTGTLTLGEPVFQSIQKDDRATILSENEILSIAASIEMHSLHPLARTIVKEAQKRNLPIVSARFVHEEIGKGISGHVDSAVYTIERSKEKDEPGIILGISVDSQEIATIHFSDVIKNNVAHLFDVLKKHGTRVAVITGDKQSAAEALLGSFNIDIYAENSPEDKFDIVGQSLKNGETVIMVGDGLNDVPALARADVGVVFSGSDNAASIETAGVVILDSHIDKLIRLIETSDRSVSIAKQSIYVGIGLSVIGMGFAAGGYIVPVWGALIQEGIDVIVILNALRVLRG